MFVVWPYHFYIDAQSDEAASRRRRPITLELLDASAYQGRRSAGEPIVGLQVVAPATTHMRIVLEKDAQENLTIVEKKIWEG